MVINYSFENEKQLLLFERIFLNVVKQPNH